MNKKCYKLFLVMSTLPISFVSSACDLHAGIGGFGGFGNFDPLMQLHAEEPVASVPTITHKQAVVAETDVLTNIKVGYDITAEYKNVELKFTASSGIVIESEESISIDGLKGHHTLVYRVETPGAHSIEIETNALTSNDTVYSDKQRILISAF